MAADPALAEAVRFMTCEHSGAKLARESGGGVRPPDLGADVDPGPGLDLGVAGIAAQREFETRRELAATDCQGVQAPSIPSRTRLVSPSAAARFPAARVAADEAVRVIVASLTSAISGPPPAVGDNTTVRKPSAPYRLNHA